MKFTLTEKTAGRIALGYQSTGSGSAANPMIYFDGVTIKWTDPLKALKAEYNDALDEANLALDNSDYINVQGTERTNLAATLIAKPAETEAGYTAAIEALNSATAAFKNAKSSYDELAEINAAAAKLGLEELSAESGDEAIEQAHVQNVPVYIKVNADFTFPVSLGSWTETGATQQIHDQHWDGTTGNGASTYYEPNQWGAGSVNWEISQTLAGLPAGDYVLMATGRRSGDVTMTMSAAGESVSTFPNADFGLGVDKSGAANFGEGDFARERTGRGVVRVVRCRASRRRSAGEIHRRARAVDAVGVSERQRAVNCLHIGRKIGDCDDAADRPLARDRHRRAASREHYDGWRERRALGNCQRGCGGAADDGSLAVARHPAQHPAFGICQNARRATRPRVLNVAVDAVDRLAELRPGGLGRIVKYIRRERRLARD